MYGFVRGNGLTKATVRVLREAMDPAGGISELLGHVGGDDAVVPTPPDRAEHSAPADSWGWENLLWI